MLIAIIGAGIGGLTTALSLPSSGVDVQIFEQAEEIRVVGAGLALWANAFRVFDQLGLGASVRKTIGAEISGSIWTDKGEMLSEVSVSYLNETFGMPKVHLHRAQLLDILRSAVEAKSNVSLALRKQLTRYDLEPNGKVALSFSDGSKSLCDLVIGADGIHSHVRRVMFPDASVEYAGYTGWRGVCRLEDDAWHAIRWGEVWGAGNRFGLTPMERPSIYWFATKNVAPGMKDDEPSCRKAELSALFREWYQPIPAIIEATPNENILRGDVLALQPLSSWIDSDKIVLLGDAAHAMTPNMGQGAGQALEDALLLGTLLSKELQAKAPSFSSALRTYEETRLRHVEKVTRFSREAGAIGQWENPLLRRLRDFYLMHVDKSFRKRRVSAILGGTATRRRVP